ncbi:MAG TPA: SpoIID/LytB domain-containing protein [Actinomycetota bacterium]|nr:SpoIID/LytB domain-containing protein [Actinomycetota bacterium]
MSVRSRLLLASLVVTATTLAISPAATALGRAGPVAPHPAGPGAASAAPLLSPVTFVPSSPGASETVNETYPQLPGVCPPNQPQPVTASYPGTLEVGREADGNLYLISQMTFTQYLDGIAEVPPSWPMAALEAQAVAARTYAISHMNGGTVDGLDYNLCATDQCQVYSGSQVSNGPWGEDWDQAVANTAGQILQYQGKPIDALYFSTSDGHTYSNSTVFGGSPLPYLQPVVENDDAASPTSHWSVTMPLTDLAQTLNLAGAWGTGAISSVNQQGTNLTVSGSGQSKTLSITSFRNDLNNFASCLTPRRYPTAASSGGHLPQTVPSIWMTAAQQGSNVVLAGRGWGHGVGMVQWGAHGKAELGQSYTQILGYYYGGLQPATVPEPGSIRVLLATGLQQVTVAPTGSIAERGGPASTLSVPVTITGGPAMTITPAAAGAIPPTLTVDGISVTMTARAGHPTAVGFTLSHAANVGFTYQGAGVTGTVAATPFAGGPQSLSWDPAAAGLAPGSYQVALVASDGISQVVSAPVTVTLKAPPPPSPSPSALAAPSLTKHPRPAKLARPGGTGLPAPILAAIVVGLAALLAGAGTLYVLRWRKPS